VKNERERDRPAIAEGASESVQFYLQNSIAESTRRAYNTAIRHYKEYCEFRGWHADAVATRTRAEEWIASLGDHGALSTTSIRLYRSALATWHTERSPTDNPFRSERVSRIIDGIERTRAEKERVQRAARPRSDGVTLEMLRPLINEHAESSGKPLMCIAAAALGAATGLRPGELLGRYPDRSTALQQSQISFFSDAAGRLTIQPNNMNSSNTTGSKPDHCTITLHISKTNQRRALEQVHVSAPAAVRALWQWQRTRCNEEGAWFRLTGHRTLSTPALLKFLTAEFRAIGKPLHLTGKCFRIGATSALNAKGAATADLQNIGRWRSNGMWTTYADAAS
jgi:hypothetical protein